MINSFLDGQIFYLDRPEPIVEIGMMQIAFPPSEQFKTRLVIKEGENVVGETEFWDENAVRAGAFAEVRAKKGTQKLGTGSGKRTFEVYVNDALAGKFVFSLTKSTGGDPLDPKVAWKIVGPWKDLAILKHKADDGSRQDLLLTYWVANYELSAPNNKITTILKKGGTVIAKNEKARAYGLAYSQIMLPLVRANNNPYTVKDLSSMAGTYTIEVQDGTRPLRNWTFSIAGGEFVSHPRSDFNKTSHLSWLPGRIQIESHVSPFYMFWLGPKE
ncbi:MAG: hypothetical protein R2688_07100 [Fimbriimonadaceae bacterium]